MNIPKSVQQIIDKLKAEGYEAYAVGGCVRDMLLDREPQDWDITTGAEPDEVKRIFPVTIDTGLEHGTVTVRQGGESFEVTTFRTDGKYRDHRRPEEVHFTKSLKEDLLRRDFTINAMAWDGELIDLYGGQQDLAAGIIRCVGDPDRRFEEDALRILRAFRFAAQLSVPGRGSRVHGKSSSAAPAGTDGPRRHFTIEPETREAIWAHSGQLKFISAERIQMEMTKIITSEHPEVIFDMYELGVTKVILPELDHIMEASQNVPHHSSGVGVHTVRSMQAIEPLPHLRWTMLLHDMGKPSCRDQDADGRDHFIGHAAEGAEIARDIMNRLKMDNATRDRVVRLVRCHDDRMPPSMRAVRRAVARIGTDLFADYCKVRRADILAQSRYLREEKLATLDAIEEIYAQILEEEQCIKLADLAVDGNDLMQAGVPKGPEIGNILHRMLDWVLDDPSLNEKDKLMQRWKEEAGSGRKEP